MTLSDTWLLEYKMNVYSQDGEDGIIAKAIAILPVHDRWCVEFGAWDGHFCSNTRNLIENRGYSAVLIEGDRKKYEDLCRNSTENPCVIPINAFVGFDHEDNLDCILEKTAIPQNFDLLSIDIDGNDYHVWQAMTRYRPKIVCIEFNPTIPTEVHFVQAADHHVHQGASLLSLVDLGKEKGYELIAVSSVNAFFVRSEDYPLFQIQNNAPGCLRTHSEYVTYLFSGYDGKVFLQGDRSLPWHGIEMSDSRVQYLPRILRKFPASYTLIERGLFRLYCFFIRSQKNRFEKCL